MAATWHYIKAISEELIAVIKQFSLNRKHLWQKVPYLALQADGRSGYSDAYSRAYHQGYWALGASVVRGYYQIYVDLETGELVSANDPRRPPSDEAVLQIALHLEQIDAGRIIEELMVESLREIDIRFYKPEEQRKWRDSLIAKLGMKSDSYTRKADKADIAKDNLIAGLVPD